MLQRNDKIVPFQWLQHQQDGYPEYRFISQFSYRNKDKTNDRVNGEYIALIKSRVDEAEKQQPQ